METNAKQGVKPYAKRGTGRRAQDQRGRHGGSAAGHTIDNVRIQGTGFLDDASAVPRRLNVRRARALTEAVQLGAFGDLRVATEIPSTGPTPLLGAWLLVNV
jgi:hypothetical protein